MTTRLSWNAAPTSALWRDLKASFALNEPTVGKTFALVASVVGAALVLALAIVGISDSFADRPIFFLALPLAIVLGVALVLDLQRLFLALVFLRAFLNPVFDIARLPLIGGLGALLNIVVIGMAAVLWLQRRRDIRPIAWLPWLPFMLIVLVDVVRAPDRVFAQRAAAVMATYAAVYFAAFFCVRNWAEFDRTIRWFLLSSVPVFAYTIVFNLVLHGGGADGRINGPFGHPNMLAFYLVVNLAAWFAKERTRVDAPLFTSRGLAWGCYLMVLLALLAGTQTRGGWIGALIVFAMYGLWVNRAYLVVIVLGGVAAMAVPSIRERALDVTQNTEVYTYSTLNSFAWREYLWRSALDWMSPKAYAIGSGIGSFIVHSTTFFPLSNGLTVGAHNVWMQLLFDTGIVGVAAYLFWFAQPAIAVWTNRGMSARLRVAMLALMLSFAFESYGDNMLDYLVVNWPFWFLVGMVASLASHTRDPVYRRVATQPSYGLR